MAINLTDSIRIGQQLPVDSKYFNGLSPWDSLSQVKSGIPTALRHRGLTVNVQGVEYWWETGILDGDLVIKKIDFQGIIDTLGYTPLNKAGDTMSGNLILNQDPTNALQAATKQYVDTIALGINFHAPVRVATTENLNANYDNGINGVGATLTGLGTLSIDNTSVQQGDRVLIWQQTNPIENGIYEVTQVGEDVFILTRTSDADNSPVGEIVAGDYVLSLEGFANAGYGFICNTPGTIIIGTTGINFVQFNAAQAVTAGYGLKELVSNVLTIDTDVTQEKITLTRNGNSGPSTFENNVLNIPQYSGVTNLNYIPNPTDGIITSSTGEDATIPLVNDVNAGLVTSTMKATWDGKQNALGFTPADDSDVVHNTGNETIAGVKTFSSNPIAVTEAASNNSTKVATTEYVDRQVTTGANILITTSSNITTDTLGSSGGVNYSQNGRNVMINNGATPITFTVNIANTPTDFIASYTKLGVSSAIITFTFVGFLIVYPNGNLLSGGPGSTALLTRNGGTMYLLINNI